MQSLRVSLSQIPRYLIVIKSVKVSEIRLLCLTKMTDWFRCVRHTEIKGALVLHDLAVPNSSAFRLLLGRRIAA